MHYRLTRKSNINPNIIRYDKGRTTITKATEVTTDLDDIYTQLKKDVKKSNIVSRMIQKKSVSVAGRHTTSNIKPSLQVQRTNELKDLRRLYLKEQETMSKVIQGQKEREKERPKSNAKSEAEIKQGLLGEYKYYEKMGKAQLIEKLIALEYVTQKLYRRNKYLEQIITVGNDSFNILNDTLN